MHYATFRHWDHKFEWSRQEFEEWSHGVARHYGYEVKFHGIGDIPEQKKKTKKEKRRRLSDDSPNRSSEVDASKEEPDSHSVIRQDLPERNISSSGENADTDSGWSISHWIQ